MRLDHPSLSLWSGTPDAPAPTGDVPAGQEIPVTVGVRPANASNRVDVQYRVNSGETQTAAAEWIRHDADANAQYFRAVIPPVGAGDTVEYHPMCSRVGTQVCPEGEQRFSMSLRGASDRTGGTAAAERGGIPTNSQAMVFRPTEIPVYEPVVPEPELPDGRRTLPTLDWMAAGMHVPASDHVIDHRVLSATHFYEGLKTLRGHYDAITGDPTLSLPAQLSGTVVEPDETPAARILVSVELGGQAETAFTDERGSFVLHLPRNAGLHVGEDLTLTFKGANGAERRAFDLNAIGQLGVLGVIRLGIVLASLPQSITGSLRSLFDIPGPGSSAAPPPPATQAAVQIKLGDSDNPLTYNYNLAQEHFPYSLLVRLVEPRTSTLTSVLRTKSTGMITMSQYVSGEHGGAGGTGGTGIIGAREFAQRVPVDQPISVDGFRDRIIGLEAGSIGSDETVPMAGTLGLGYVVEMAQRWTPAGLSLGDLVYSLPLAPGEQQRVAVFEQRQKLSVSEIESLDQQEKQEYQQATDSSSLGTFNSAFDEHVRGSSQYDTRSHTSSGGVTAGVSGIFGKIAEGVGVGGALGGGYSESGTTASGSASQSLDGARNYASRAAEQMHSAVERQASARRGAQRTSMRLASSEETLSVTTKVITNNNRAHALTIQYWQVLRHFDVTTAIDGVTLVCFVPLQVVRFLPAGQLYDLDPASVNSRRLLLRRYAAVLKHADVIRPWLPIPHHEGLSLLETFAANPRYQVRLDTFEQTIIHVSLWAVLLRFDQVFVSIRIRGGGTVGPVELLGVKVWIPDRFYDPDHAYHTEKELLQGLREKRYSALGNTHVANITLPEWVAPQDVIGFELTRSFQPLDYQFIPVKEDPIAEYVKALSMSGGLMGPAIEQEVEARITGVHYSPADLERELGGPQFSIFDAYAFGRQGEAPDPYAHVENRLAPLPTTAYPIPALPVPPRLKFSDVLKIERTMQHVVRDTTGYSRIVWASLTSEERAILLEGYTIGVPKGGVVDETQDIPLLNCVANEVLGFYGNAMIMPFSLPPVLASGTTGKPPLTTGQIQDALTTFHRGKFSPPVSRVTLPTQGVLAEAVLGQSPSAEKIDLTRFWNWGDSPIPQAPDIPASLLSRAAPLGTAVSAPNTLGSIPPIINNITTGTAGGADGAGSIIKALAGARAEEKPFSDAFTGAKELAGVVTKTLETGESARSDALKQAQAIAAKTLDALPQVLKTIGEKEKEDEKKKEEEEKKKKKEDAEKKEKDKDQGDKKEGSDKKNGKDKEPPDKKEPVKDPKKDGDTKKETGAGSQAVIEALLRQISQKLDAIAARQ